VVEEGFRKDYERKMTTPSEKREVLTVPGRNITKGGGVKIECTRTIPEKVSDGGGKPALSKGILQSKKKRKQARIPLNQNDMGDLRPKKERDINSPSKRKIQNTG